MQTLLIAVLSFAGFLAAYRTYGRWLAQRVFALDPQAIVPAVACRDDVDYVPTRRSIVFGHHFTSIAGTGPIVGPALAVFWGWLPALLWVVFGCVLIGAVHDLSTLVVSLRNRGQTIGEIAGRVISKRARVLFLLILFFSLVVVLAIFGLVIATIFKLYPGSVLAVWASLPLAVMVGLYARTPGRSIAGPSIASLTLVYACIWIGVRYLPISMAGFGEPWNPIVLWTLTLLVYCFFASVLPVWLLLQPRDYINAQQLVVALVLLVGGLAAAGATGQADLSAAPAVAANPPADAPPLIPFLFITIACGAVSGFHCLVSSGTSSKQLASETDALSVGYGAMLLEGALSVIVILACTAGLGMGKVLPSGEKLVGRAAWEAQYSTSWSSFGLAQTVGAFVEGGANFLGAIGIPLDLAIGVVAVVVACFAATTLDSATRLQRYVIQGLGDAFGIKPLSDKYVATAVAVGLGGLLAMMPAAAGQPAGTGGRILWPLFGAINQLLAGLSLMVVVFHLWRRGMRLAFALIPMTIMLVLPVWALAYDAFHPQTGFLARGDHLLFVGSLAVMALQAWMVVEGLLVWRSARGVLEETLPPLPETVPT